MRWYGRLRRSGEIAYVRRAGRAASRSCLVAYAVPARDGRTAVAISVSKAVGGAVLRNLVRRRVRGALDAAGPSLPHLRMLVVAKPSAALVPYESLARDLSRALEHLAARS